MRTLIVIGIGLAVLVVTALTARALGGRPWMRTGVLVFIACWLVFSAIDFCIGVFSAGYSARSELGIHAAIFGVPAIVAVGAWYLMRDIH